MTLAERINETIGTAVIFFAFGFCSINVDYRSSLQLLVVISVFTSYFVGSYFSKCNYNPILTLSSNYSFGKFLSFSSTQLTGIVLALVPMHFFSEIGGVPENGFEFFDIFIFEFIFSFLLVSTYLFLDKDEKPVVRAFFFALVYFLAFKFGARFSGAILNPALVIGLVVLRVIGHDQVFVYLSAQVLSFIAASYIFKLINK